MPPSTVKLECTDPRERGEYMTESPRFTLNATVLDSPDAQELADFYENLLGWRHKVDEPERVMLVAPDDGSGLSFQTDHSDRRAGARARCREVAASSAPGRAGLHRSAGQAFFLFPEEWVL